MSGTPSLKITRVLANAGSGKTHKLSADFLAIAHRGVIEGDPARLQSILATTFTVASARDIRNIVLLRAANAVLENGKRRELAQSIFHDPQRFAEVKCEELLDALVQRLDRLEIRTIDAFLNRLAAAFSLELGLAPGTRPITGPAVERIHTQAIARIIRSNPQEMRSLFQTVLKGKAKRDLVGRMVESIDSLLALWRDSRSDTYNTQLGPPPAWVRPEELEVVDEQSVRDAIQGIRHLVDSGALKSPKACVTILESEDLLLRLLDQPAQDVEVWKGLLKGGPLSLVAMGKTSFYRARFDPTAFAHMKTVVRWIRFHITRLELCANIATCQLAEKIDEQVSELLFQSGACTFDSITRAVGESLAHDTISEILYRLDGKIDHLLLDEFQDTSLSQWRALQPLAESIAAGGENERSILAVGDAKQSIYGWRKGDPRLLRGLRRLLNEDGHADVTDEILRTSWRSSPVLLAAVDHVFGSLLNPMHPLRKDVAKNGDSNFDCAIESWMDGYAGHVATEKNAKLTGCVRWQLTDRNEHLDFAAAQATKLWRRSGGQLRIAVMARGNKDVALIAQKIRSQENAPPCALLAGASLTTSPAVVALIDAISFAAHPDHLTSLMSVLQSPLPKVWGVEISSDWQRASTASERSRAAQSLRLKFANDSVAETLSRWVSKLDLLPEGTPFDDGDRRRVAEMISEIGRLEQSGAGFDEIIDALRAFKLQDVPAHSIHAINVHQAKGLEWDIVIFAAQSTKCSPRRAIATERGDEYRGPDCDRIAPKMSAGHAAELVQQIIDSSDQFDYQEFLSTLYVAITRAKRGLWIVVDNPSTAKDESGCNPQKQPELRRSHGAILRHALENPAAAMHTAEMQSLDDESWIDQAGDQSHAPPSLHVTAPAMPAHPTLPRMQTRIARSASALSERPTPQNDEKPGLIDPQISRDALARGSIAHAICESIEWIDDWRIDQSAIESKAKSIAPFLSAAEIQATIAQVSRQLTKGEIARALARPREAAVALPERGFLHFSEQGGLRQGAIDRIVLHGTPGNWTRIEIFDFKTDSPLGDASPEWVKSRADHHRPQLDAYRDAMAAEYGVDPSKISISIVLLAAAKVVLL